MAGAFGERKQYASNNLEEGTNGKDLNFLLSKNLLLPMIMDI